MLRLPEPLRRLIRKPPQTPGRRGEQFAEQHLRTAGYKTVARNLRSRLGEIDLLCIAPDGRTLVFIEVKTAAPDRASAVPPEHRVGRQKQRKIAHLATRLIQKHRLTGRPIRFDIIGVTLHHDREADIRHYPAAFESPW